METYRSDTERQPDITLDGTKEDYEKLRKQYPHLSIEECEYSCAGAEFYMKLLKHQGFMIHASAVEKEGKAYLFSAPSGTGKSTHGFIRFSAGSKAEVSNIISRLLFRR